MTRYRCQACHREYSLKEQSEECARECVSKLRMSFFSFGKLSDDQLGKPKLLLSNQPVLASTATSVAGSQPSSQAWEDPLEPVAAKPAAKVISRPEKENAPIKSGPNLKLVSNEESPSQKSAANQVAAAPRPPRDRTKKFFRDGARYVCVECSTKFFTKEDVEACWEAHP